ncbi:hypothetical protein [Bacillus velezensis]|uniref:hypothetical protein n=1 Tax=Bacillus velezensis TaxID=492670 RepID=UPI0011A7FEEA|nr:hypothetical protein [Bacillus velezensis]
MSIAMTMFELPQVVKEFVDEVENTKNCLMIVEEAKEATKTRVYPEKCFQIMSPALKQTVNSIYEIGKMLGEESCYFKGLLKRMYDHMRSMLNTDKVLTAMVDKYGIVKIHVYNIKSDKETVYNDVRFDKENSLPFLVVQG